MADTMNRNDVDEKKHDGEKLFRDISKRIESADYNGTVDLILERAGSLRNDQAEQIIVKLYEKKYKPSPEPEDEPQGLLSVLLWEFKQLAAFKSKQLETVGKLIKLLTGGNISKFYQKDQDGNFKSFVMTRELFLWAVMTEVDDVLSRKIWEQLDEDHIANVLVASMMMRTISDKLLKRSFTLPTKEEDSNTTVENYRQELRNKSKMYDHATTILEKANEYDRLSMVLLGKCLVKNSYYLSYLLIRELPQWSNKSLLLMKYHDNEMVVTEEDVKLLDVVHQRMNETWYKNIATDNSSWKILLGIFAPFPTLDYITFRYTEKMTRISRGSHFETILERKFEGKDHESFLHRCYQFYSAPVVKFYLHTMSYLVFLILFSIFIVTDLDPDRFSIYEYLVWTWALTMWFDEIRQMFDAKPKSLFRKLQVHFHEYWNRFDLLCYAVLLVAVVLRCIPSAKYFDVASILYALNCAMFMLRILQFFYFSTKFGPRVVMIFRMLEDLPFFFFVFGVFMSAYGIPAHAILYPKAPLSGSTLFQVVASPYYAIFGQQTDLSNQLSGQCTYNYSTYTDGSDLPRCSWFVELLFSAYLVISNILLINLLIAILNSTYTNEENNSKKKWIINRIDISKEYMKKSTLVPPLVIFSHLARIILYIWIKCRSCKIQAADDMYSKQSMDYQYELFHTKLRKMEKDVVEEYVGSQRKDERYATLLSETLRLQTMNRTGVDYML